MPRPGRQTTERAKDFKGTLLQLLKTMGAYKISLIVVIVFAILSTIFNIAGPKILAKATTALATGWIARLRGVGSIDFGYIGKILLILQEHPALRPGGRAPGASHRLGAGACRGAPGAGKLHRRGHPCP